MSISIFVQMVSMDNATRVSETFNNCIGLTWKVYKRCKKNVAKGFIPLRRDKILWESSFIQSRGLSQIF
jgi:hypothetical protein